MLDATDDGFRLLYLSAMVINISKSRVHGSILDDRFMLENEPSIWKAFIYVAAGYYPYIVYKFRSNGGLVQRALCLLTEMKSLGIYPTYIHKVVFYRATKCGFKLNDEDFKYDLELGEETLPFKECVVD